MAQFKYNIEKVVKFITNTGQTKSGIIKKRYEVKGDKMYHVIDTDIDSQFMWEANFQIGCGIFEDQILAESNVTTM